MNIELVTYFNESVRPLMATTGETSYVVDFAFLDDGSLKVCFYPLYPIHSSLIFSFQVIELNPMTEASHACLFDWSKDKGILFSLSFSPLLPFPFLFYYLLFSFLLFCFILIYLMQRYYGEWTL